jgi:multicomponent Na+:H+ antiporter subunit E
MMTRVLLVGWLTLVWVLLWGEASVGNLVAGLALGVLVVAAFPPAEEQGRGIRPLAVLSFGWWFAKALVVANLQVAAQIVRPRLALEEGIVAVPLRSSSPVVATFVANAITLTPGTLTVDIRPAEFGVDEHDAGREPVGTPVLFVHCLVTGDPEDVRADGLELEERVVRAFGTAADREAILGPAPAWPPPTGRGTA